MLLAQQQGIAGLGSASSVLIIITIARCTSRSLLRSCQLDGGSLAAPLARHGLLLRTPPLQPPPRARRAITAEQFGALALPVAEFLAVEHGTAYLG